MGRVIRGPWKTDSGWKDIAMRVEAEDAGIKVFQTGYPGWDEECSRCGTIMGPTQIRSFIEGWDDGWVCPRCVQAWVAENWDREEAT